jgi:hypothetical protein
VVIVGSNGSNYSRISGPFWGNRIVHYSISGKNEKKKGVGEREVNEKKNGSLLLLLDQEGHKLTGLTQRLKVRAILDGL